MSEVKQGSNGRPLSLKTRAYAHADEALSALLAVSNDPTAPHEVRVQAATQILNLAGAIQKNNVGVKDGN